VLAYELVLERRQRRNIPTFRPGPPDVDEVVRLWDRKRSQQHGIHDGEHRRAGTDSKCRGDDRGDGERRCASHAAQRKADVGGDILRGPGTTRLASGLLELFRTTEGELRLALRVVLRRRIGFNLEVVYLLD